ncbi:scarecrow-like protein 9 [Salvia miltiorrhiza]|uniref:scarecrow-like protein 9 n=1 Tax=Salvia miltiorrhiza TaxID=226208 RepID=UPI0025AD01C0|nr:scarecrow-like protein 9 [Salvia miltiorrhiza]
MGTISRCDSRNEFQLSYAAECGGYNPSQAAVHHSSEAPVPCDYFDGVFDYIKQMLMEEDDLDHRPCMFHDCSALQAAEKYFSDALGDRASSPPPPPLDFGGSASGNFPPCSDIVRDVSTISCDLDWLAESRAVVVDSNLPDQDSRNFHQVLGERRRNSSDDAAAAVKKTRDRGDSEEERRSKQFAGYAEESVQLDKYDKSLLCPKLNPRFYDDSPPSLDEDDDDDSEEESKKQYRKTKEVKRGRPKGSKKNRKVSQVVDLRTLLTRCAEAVSTFNAAAAQTLLKQIRNHSSPYGDPNERLAHCFANALEARMSGTGSALYTASAARSIPAAQLLKSYQTYVTACPFKRMSNIFANKSIGKLSREATKLHIIDFGILYGFQWPCIIHGLSLKPGGPPTLKITGIDYPQPGFKPAERVEQTGRRLVECCKRFNVPFEYKAIAERWDDVGLEDLEIERDEMVVVNCLYRLRHTADESDGVNSQRDAVLKLIKRINPQVLVHGVVNGSYNASYFPTRFKEALFHYSSAFDMMEATLPREDEDRLLYEREVYGRDVMNVIACEGPQRLERPDTYKQWQLRNQRAGFRLLPLNREIVEEVRAKVRSDYHSDFLLEEDGGWLLQGWKGRVMYALSCWKTSN